MIHHPRTNIISVPSSFPPYFSLFFPRSCDRDESWKLAEHVDTISDEEQRRGAKTRSPWGLFGGYRAVNDSRGEREPAPRPASLTDPRRSSGEEWRRAPLVFRADAFGGGVTYDDDDGLWELVRSFVRSFARPLARLRLVSYSSFVRNRLLDCSASRTSAGSFVARGFVGWKPSAHEAARQTESSSRQSTVGRQQRQQQQQQQQQQQLVAAASSSSQQPAAAVQGGTFPRVPSEALQKRSAHAAALCYVVPTSLLGARDRGCGCGSDSPICLYASMPCLPSSSMSACMPACLSACLSHACMHARFASFSTTDDLLLPTYSFSLLTPTPLPSFLLLLVLLASSCLPSLRPPRLPSFLPPNCSIRSFHSLSCRSSYAFLLLSFHLLLFSSFSYLSVSLLFLLSTSPFYFSSSLSPVIYVCFFFFFFFFSSFFSFSWSSLLFRGSSLSRPSVFCEGDASLCRDPAIRLRRFAIPLSFGLLPVFVSGWWKESTRRGRFDFGPVVVRRTNRRIGPTARPDIFCPVPRYL